MNWREFKSNFNFPCPIRFGSGVIEELGDHLRKQQIERPLIVTDQTVVQLDFFKKILIQLDRRMLRPSVFSQIHKNPVKSDVEAAAEVYERERCDAIVGIGGGAPMDVSRALCVLAYHPEDLFYYEETSGGDQNITSRVPYFVTVPTTAGTGSEVGRSAIISDDETKEKKIIFSPYLMARQVFADPLLTMDLPRFVTAATGMDALTHNLEAVVSKNWHPMCEGIGMEGIRLIARAIEGAVNSPNEENRTMMLMASLMGAVAFQKGLGVVHSCAHPLSIRFDTHHGLANALMIPYGVQFNMDVCGDRFRQMAKLFGGENLPETLLALNEKLGLPTRLSQIEIEQRHLDDLAHLGFLDFCHPNNPKPVREIDFQQIYQMAL